MYLENLKDNHYYVIDIETDAIDATKIWCAVIQSLSTDEVWKFRPHEMDALRDFITNKNKKPATKWVGHNALSFDIPVINRLLALNLSANDVVDTLILSNLYHPHIRGGHSLAAWGERLNDDKIDFHDFSQFTEEMLTYCVQDVALTARVYRNLVKKMTAQGFSEMSCEIEHKIRVIINDQTRNGVLFDERKATILLADFESRKAELEERIRTVFKPELVLAGEYTYRVRQDGTPYASYNRHLAQYPKITWSNTRSKYRTWRYKDFNIGSPKQRVERLLSLGWEPREFTPVTPKGGGGNPKVTEDALIEFAETSGIPEVELIKDWMLYETRVSSLKEWLRHTKDSTGRIHGRVYSCGAGTRRMRHTTPNTANICGVDKPYGADMRSLWRVPDGKLMVGIDAKGLEGRVLMHYLNSAAAVEIFMSGDVHQMNADAVSKALGVTISRQACKGLYYAFLYGASDSKLGKMVGLKRRHGALIRQAIMDNVPGLEGLTKNCVAEYWATTLGWMGTIDGGFVRCPSPHAALNYRCQSAGGILMKVATILAYGMSIDSVYASSAGAYVRYSEEGVSEESVSLENPWDLTRCKKILDVHDEVQMESDIDYAEECGKIYCDAITLAGELLGFNIKQEGDYNVGQNWAETH